MDIKKIYRLYKGLHPLRPLYFLIISIVFLLIGIYALRQNNFKMIQLRQNVITTDQQDGDVEKALQELRAHVHGHMNTNLSSGEFAIKPPIQLKARYDRLMAVEQQRIKAANAEVAKRAEAACAAQFPAAGFNAPRVACIQEYVRSNGIKANSIPDELYKFDFVSPKWSPDLAGLSLLASGIFFLLFISRWLLERWLKQRLE